MQCNHLQPSCCAVDPSTYSSIARDLCPMTSIFPSRPPSHQPLGITILLSDSMNSAFSYSTYVISYNICLSPSDISLSTLPSRSIHVVANDRIPSFSWVNNSPVCVCAHTRVYAHVCLPHRLSPFTHQWTHRWFPRLGYCNGAAVTVGCMYLSEILFSFPLICV